MQSKEQKEQLKTQVGTYEAERLERLAQEKNTSVYKVKHDKLHEPWPVNRLRPVLERLAARVVSFGDDVDDFTVRKTCIDEDKEVLAFQRDHTQLYWLLTDRKMVKEERFRNAMKGLLQIREKVEAGDVDDSGEGEGSEADAMATRTVLAALGNQHVNDKS